MQDLIKRPCVLSHGRSPDTCVLRARRHSAELETPPLLRRVLLAAVVVTALGVSQPVLAIDSPSFPILLQQAQADAPRLLEQAANVRATDADLRQSRAWLNPTLSASAENLGVAQAGVSQRENTYSIAQVFEIGGKRAARIEAGRQLVLSAAARARHARIAYASELAVAYASAEAMQQRHEVAKQELERSRDDLRAAEALVKAGREADLRQAQARAALAAAEAALESAVADETGALARLSALAGAAEPFTRVVHPFPIDEPRPAAAAWTPEDAPALVSASAERNALAAQVRIEERRWVPDIGVSVGMRKFGWTDERAATVSISASIPLFDRNKAGIDAARERANSAALRVDGARLDAIATHRSALAQVEASARRVQAAEQGETAASDAYRLGRIGYESGKTSLLELLSIRRLLAEAMERTIEARLDRVRALATLSLAEGRIAFGEKQ